MLMLNAERKNNSAFLIQHSYFICTFAVAYVERFDLIATTRKNAKTMLFPWVPEPVEGPFQSTTSHTNFLLTN